MVSSSSTSSTSVTTLMGDKKPRNWSELPPGLTSSILLRLGTIEILENAQKVCKSWYRVCKDPWMWKKIDIDNRTKVAGFKYDLESMCRHAVDRSQGGLTEIEIWSYGGDDLIKYIVNRSSNLRSLGLVRCFPITAVAKLPMLEELGLTYCPIPGKSLRAIGQSCPNLKTLRLNYNPEIGCLGNALDSDAIVIAESMPKLQNLQLLGNGITNLGLKAILDGCPHLEHLDLRQCYNIKLMGDLEKQCLERIKDLRRPNDSRADCPYEVNHHGTDSDEDFTIKFL